jgi:sugar phosphate isomerase/epimerase
VSVLHDEELRRLSVHEFCRSDLPLDVFLKACAGAGVGSVDLLRAPVEKFGLDKAVHLLDELGLTVGSYSAAGYWSTGYDSDGRRWTLEDNIRQLEAAAAVGAGVQVLAGGPLDMVTRDIDGARRRVAEGIRELWPHAAERGIRLAIEPLHPIFCPHRSVVTSLRFALDLVEDIPARWGGIALDSYHVWWDPELAGQVQRAAGRIFTVHIDDFILPLPPDLRRRGLMGEGCIDLTGFRRLVEAAGYTGHYAVEVLNEELSALPPAAAIGRIVESYRAFIRN